MGGYPSVLCALRNGGIEPVYEAEISIRSNYLAESGAMTSFPFLIPPQTTREVWVDGVMLPEGGLAELPYVELTFTDVNGLHWLRDHHGGLHEIDSAKTRDWWAIVRALDSDRGPQR